jgi:hypothetical protein
MRFFVRGEWLVLNFSDAMLIGDMVEEPAETLRMLRNGIGIYDLYIIFINKNNKSLLEMAESTRFFDQKMTQRNAEPIAIANGRSEALCIIKNMILKNIDVISNARTFQRRLIGLI